MTYCHFTPPPPNESLTLYLETCPLHKISRQINKTLTASNSYKIWAGCNTEARVSNIWESILTFLKLTEKGQAKIN